MLTSTNPSNQYLRPEYLSPLPTTVSHSSPRPLFFLVFLPPGCLLSPDVSMNKIWLKVRKERKLELILHHSLRPQYRRSYYFCGVLIQVPSYGYLGMIEVTALVGWLVGGVIKKRDLLYGITKIKSLPVHSSGGHFSTRLSSLCSPSAIH